MKSVSFPTQPEVEWHLLRLLLSHGSVKTEAAYDALAEELSITSSQLRETIGSGDQEENRWHNLCRFARRRLVDQGLMNASPHGVWSLTDKGADVASRMGARYMTSSLSAEELGF